jgi:hypothetical protein
MALSKITTESLLDGEITAAKFATGVGGKVVQVVHVEQGASSTGTTVIPHDNTIPQKTEGDEYMTLAITPTNASNKLLIEVKIANVTNSNGGAIGMATALFQDTTAGALSSIISISKTAGHAVALGLVHYMTAGTTSETTMKVRIGGSGAGTTTFNGAYGGGTLASNITIWEISA